MPDLLSAPAAELTVGLIISLPTVTRWSVAVGSFGGLHAYLESASRGRLWASLAGRAIDMQAAESSLQVIAGRRPGYAINRSVEAEQLKAPAKLCELRWYPTSMET